MKNKGITLIALVITIIVLLILSSIGTSMLMGDNGILFKAKTAKENSDASSVEESNRLGTYNQSMESYTTSRGTTTYNTKEILSSPVEFALNTAINQDISIDSFAGYDYLEITSEAFQNVNNKWLGKNITRLKISDINFNTGSYWYDQDDSVYYAMSWFNNIPIDIAIWIKDYNTIHIVGVSTSATNISKERIKSITAVKY